MNVPSLTLAELLVHLPIRRLGLAVLLASVVLAGACQDSAAPQLPPTPAPVQFVLMREALDAETRPAQSVLTLAGFVVSQNGGGALVPGLVFDAAGGGYIPEKAAVPIWLGADLLKNSALQLETAGALHYAPALIHGALEGPGTYGPDGHYTYQIAEPRLESWAPVEGSIGALLDDSQSYRGRLVRVLGGLLLRNGSALLVDALGPGGIPAQQARQIKLLGSIDAPQILTTLSQSPSGVVRFGQVQVEGVLRGTSLVPLAIRPVR